MLIGFVEDRLLPTKTIQFEADFANHLLYVNKFLDLFFLNEVLMPLQSLIAPEGK